MTSSAPNPLTRTADLPEWDQGLCTPEELAAGLVNTRALLQRRHRAERAAIGRNGGGDRHVQTTPDGYRTTALVEKTSSR